MSDVPSNLLAEAIYNRGTDRQLNDDLQGAIADYTTLIEMDDIQPELKGEALINRGAARAELEEMDLAIADSTAALEMDDIPPELKAEALINRATDKECAGHIDEAKADYKAVIEFESAEDEYKARACGNYGWLLYVDGDYEQSLDISRAGLRLDPTQTYIRANIGLNLLHLGQTEEAVKEYDLAIMEIEDVEDMDMMILEDLNAAIQENAGIPGASEIIEKAEQRKKELPVD